MFEVARQLPSCWPGPAGAGLQYPPFPFHQFRLLSVWPPSTHAPPNRHISSQPLTRPYAAAQVVPGVIILLPCAMAGFEKLLRLSCELVGVGDVPAYATAAAALVATSLVAGIAKVRGARVRVNTVCVWCVCVCGVCVWGGGGQRGMWCMGSSGYAGG